MSVKVWEIGMLTQCEKEYKLARQLRVLSWKKHFDHRW